MSDRQTILNQFMSITGSSSDEATSHLDSNSWDIEASVSSFYEGQGGNKGSHSSKPIIPSNKPRVATFNDLSSETNEEDDDGPDYFAGGEKSGVMMKGRSEKKDSGQASGLVKEILEQAANAGPSPEEFQRKEKKFTGAGHVLGADVNSSSSIPDSSHSDNDKEVVERRLTFWKDGFSVDDGPLRRYEDPENEEFLRAIKSGRAPTHLLNVANDQLVEVKVSHRLEEVYVPPPKVFKAFAGGGQRLGAPTSVPINESSMPGGFPSSNGPEVTRNAGNSLKFSVDENLPFTSIQIRLGDGTRMVARFNHTHTVGDIRSFINAPGEASRQYALMTTFPNKELKENSMTIKDGNLLNAVIVQKYV